MKTILLDSEIYYVPDKAFDEIQRLHGHCIGSCNDYTLKNLKEGCERIKRTYSPEVDIDLKIQTPRLEEDLPF